MWGSWCAPCRAEALDLAAVANETATRGVRFAGLDVRHNPSAAKAFTRTYQVTYPSYDDHNGLVLSQFNEIIPLSAVPSTLVVDRTAPSEPTSSARSTQPPLRGLIGDAEKPG